MVTSSLTVAFSADAQTVALTAQVSSPVGAPGAGTVTFSVAGSRVGPNVTAPASSSGSVTAQFRLSGGVGAGSYPITAAYGGSTGFAPSTSDNATLTVTAGPTLALTGGDSAWRNLVAVGLILAGLAIAFVSRRRAA
jgi:LPXTG-motif cell wall-anchored protein